METFWTLPNVIPVSMAPNLDEFSGVCSEFSNLLEPVPGYVTHNFRFF